MTPTAPTPPTAPTQRIEIELGPSGPASVRFLSPGPLLEEAKRLAAIPGGASGWSAGDADGAFLVDPKLVRPRPLRKGRPDASARMAEYNARRWGKGKAEGAPAPTPATDAMDLDF